MPFDAGSIAGDIALNLGPYMASLGTAVSSGAAAAGRLSDEMQSVATAVTGPLTSAFHAAAEAVKQIGEGNAAGALSSIGEAAGEAAGEATSAMGSLAGAIGNFAGGPGAGVGVEEMFKGIGEAVAGVAAQNPAEIFRGLGEAMASLYEIASGVAARFLDVGLAAQRAGVDTEWMSGLAAVAERSNVGIDQLVGGFKILEQRAQEASEGGKEAAKGFERLGISVQEAADLSAEPQKLFERVQQAIGQMGNQSERGAAALGVLGRAGFNLVPVLSESTEAMEKMKATEEELGANVTARDVQLGQSWKEMTTVMSEAWEGIEKQLTGPVLQYVQDHLGEIVQGVKDAAAVIVDVVVPAVELMMEALGPLLKFLEGISSLTREITDDISSLFGVAGGVPPDTGAVANRAGTGGGKGSLTTGDIHVHNEAGESVAQLAGKLKTAVRDSRASSDAQIAAAARHRAVEHAIGGDW